MVQRFSVFTDISSRSAARPNDIHAALPDGIDAIVLLAVDQPRPSWFIKQVLDAHKSTKAVITCPRYDGHGGHPLIFDISLMLELDRISEYSHGVREVMRNHADEINWSDVDSPLARLDMNTPDSYDAAREVYAAHLKPEATNLHDGDV